MLLGDSYAKERPEAQKWLSPSSIIRIRKLIEWNGIE